MEIVGSFSGFSVTDTAAARSFYETVLQLRTEESMGGFKILLPKNQQVYVYGKPDHQPATYTVLNLIVADIAVAVAALTERGVTFERYDGLEQDNNGIMRGRMHGMGPDIAWFTDPAGNILSVLQQ